MINDLKDFDDTLRAEIGCHLLCGIDEAGLGPLAGPVCCAAVILKPGAEISGINDSKKLSEAKRNLLFDQIIAAAESYSVVFIDNNTIDEINILNATMLGMKNAVQSLDTAPDYIVVDGNRSPFEASFSRSIIKGDGLSQSIAAASILAKVSRDRLMMDYDAAYPQFCFSKHKGYPTKLHYEMISQFGITPIHRKTFLKGTAFYEHR